MKFKQNRLSKEGESGSVAATVESKTNGPCAPMLKNDWKLVIFSAY